MGRFSDQVGSDRKCYACGYVIIGIEFPRCPHCGRQLRLDFRARKHPPADVVRGAVVRPPRKADGSTVAMIEPVAAQEPAEMEAVSG